MEYIILFILIAEYFIFLPKIFVKAGIDGKKGYIPVYNFFIWIRMMQKPWYWIIFLLIPGVNFLMLIAMNLELARAFGRFSVADTLLAIFLPHYMVYKVAMDKDVVFTGPTDWSNGKQRALRRQSDQVVLFLLSFGLVNAGTFIFKTFGLSKDRPEKKTVVKEWGDAVLFAIVAASIIRAFFLEAFKIPTPSMEKNLLVGDFLFVSKMSYGPKVPQTPIAIPFVHHTLPVVNTRSYLEIFKVPYLRLPGFGKVERNDVVVFNFPCGDTVFLNAQNSTYYSVLEGKAIERFERLENSYIRGKSNGRVIKYYMEKRSLYLSMIRQEEMDEGNIVVRPVDKEDHYIKRCVGLPGDKIYVKHGQLYVNGKPSGNTAMMQSNYIITIGQGIVIGQLREQLKEDFDVSYSDFDASEKEMMGDDEGNRVIIIPLTKARKKEFEKRYSTCKIVPQEYELGALQSNYKSWYHVFPNDPRYAWTGDNYACDSLGPLCIPKKGETVKLTKLNLPIYRRIIQVYEGNRLEEKDSLIIINGKITSTYTFKQDYYWMMGDNRQNSADSRYWGFVPEDHIVGKGVFVWFSSDPESGVRWNRVFTRIH